MSISMKSTDSNVTLASSDLEEEEYDEDDEEEEAVTSGCRSCDKTRTVKRKPRDIRIHYGLIASGNQVIKDAAIRDKLKKDLGNHVLCIEMEAAGLMNNFPCMVIRGICDYADSHKNDAWQEHAAAVAAAFAKELLEYVQPSDVNGERPVKDIVGQILDATSRTEAKVTTAVSKLDRKEDLEILKWITTSEYGSQQSDSLRRRQAGTGEWLLNSKEFQEWCKGSSKTLFCPGIPGAGKTILTSVVINHIDEQFQYDTTVGVAYIYCNFQRKHGAEDMIQSLLRQLSQRQPSLPKAVKALYKRHSPKQTKPLLHEVSKTLKSVAAIYSKVFIIVDALDECQASNRCRQTLLSEIFSLQAATGANFFATSRHIPEIREQFNGTLSLEIRAHDEDSRYQGSGEEKKLAVLNQAYDDAMKRIRQQSTDFTQLAERIISWITYAKRSLTVRELQHALAVEVGKSELDPDNCSHIDLMIFVCNGLVTVDEESNIIRLVHYTTQEYFEQSGSRWFPDAQTDLAITCVTYLSFDAFKSGRCQTAKAFEEKLQLHALYDYAAQNWGYHAYAQPKRMKKYVARALLAKKQNPYVQDTNKRTPLFYAAGNGHAAVVRFLLTMKGTYLHAVDRYGQTILSYAAKRGSEAVVMLLIDMDGINLDTKSNSEQTPLSHAAEKGHEAVVKLLLASKCVDPNSQCLELQTPLSYAADAGHEGIVKLLLGTDGVNPDAKDRSGRTPLSLAASTAHKAVVNLLLAAEGVNLNSKCCSSYDNTSEGAGRTPFSWAVTHGSVEVEELLLAKHGVDLDCRDANGRTPLSYAAQYGPEAVVKLLLAKNKIDPDSSDDSGRTPLSYAAERGREGVVSLLLAKDVNPDSKDNEDKTPLSHAARTQSPAVVKLLLATERVNPNSQDTEGRTPLSWAAKGYNEATVMLLLATSSVDPDLRSKDGRTALSYAVCDYRAAVVVQLLLANSGIDPNSKDNKGRTPLSWAAEHGWTTEAMETLLAKDNIDQDSRDNDNRTPLSYAAERGREAIIKLLLASNLRVDADSKDDSGRTPLSYAAENGQREVVDLLLATGQRVNADSKDINGRSPLSYAAGNGKTAIVELLLATDSIDANSLDSNHRTPLSWAAGIGDVEMVNLLLTNPTVDSNSPDKDGQTPFWWAAKREYEIITEQWWHFDALKLWGKRNETSDKDDESPLWAAACNGHVEIVKLLLEKYCVEPDSKNKDDESPLLAASCNGHAEIVRLLVLEDGVDIDSKDTEGKSPLWFASRNGHAEIDTGVMCDAEWT
ncbi:hypothetical protein TGAM01_v204183 [Trichoderma gamsii]|uniref:Uncharacterized protein n=1 Tax=Trichoderma gamsii TaxID=398673 RepID=A0A2P4ZQZ3_9HYPO|nr:hypothetical protein TGAM01_v204183 [Trichoderma gamsii]PON26682.1 hypothetical protein TGAM01_v204183 [Trichoderma gamsii]